jgi:hypothetical protein
MWVAPSGLSILFFFDLTQGSRPGLSCIAPSGLSHRDDWEVSYFSRIALAVPIASPSALVEGTSAAI